MQDILDELFIQTQRTTKGHQGIEGKEQRYRRRDQGIEEKLPLQGTFYLLQGRFITCFRINHFHQKFFSFGNGKVTVETFAILIQEVLLLLFASVYKISLHPFTLDRVGTQTHLLMHTLFESTFSLSVFIPCIDRDKHFKQQKEDQKTLQQRFELIGFQSYTPVPAHS